MTPELAAVVAYWLAHPWQLVGFYALACFLGGFARAAAEDLVDKIRRRK